MKRPTAIPVNIAGIPDVLKAEHRWVTWCYELRAGRWAKILCTVAGYRAKSNDPATWTTFADALGAYQQGGFDRVGFVLGDGWAGIDVGGVTSGLRRRCPLWKRCACCEVRTVRRTSPISTYRRELKFQCPSSSSGSSRMRTLPVRRSCR